MGRISTIKGEDVALSESESQAVDNFHYHRLPFAFVTGGDGKTKLVFNLNDGRDHKQWLYEDFGIASNDFEGIIRGYIQKNKIQFYKGTDFDCIDFNKVSIQSLIELVNASRKYYDSDNIQIYNGVNVGILGEVWESKEVVDFKIVI